jgi:adenine nucleotide transporter 17
MRHFFYYFHWSFCLRQIWEVYRESGIRGYWKGLVPTLIMVSYLFLKCHTQSLFVTYGGPQLLKCVKFQVCNPSIQFMIYETLAKRLQSKRSGKQLPKRNLTAMEVQTFR